MIIFLNEEENPLPFETDPEVELDSIHKSFLKHNLPKIILSFAILAAAIIYLLFFLDTVPKDNDFLVALLILLSFYIVMDVCNYFRWRKKALAAAATGEFSRTGVPDKLISGLFIAAVVLCAVIVTAKSIVTGNREMLVGMVAVVVAMAFYEFLDKLKKKTKSNWGNRIIRFVELLIYLAVIACINFLN